MAGPGVPVFIEAPSSGVSEESGKGLYGCTALIDTGATSGCIDEDLAKELGLPIIDRRVVGGVAGKKEHNVYLTTLIVPGLKLQKKGDLIGVDLANTHNVILGRDFLYHTIMIYDGTAGVISLCT